MSIVHISEHRSREIVSTLEYLLERANRGHLRGLAFVVKTGPKRHKIGFAGHYWEDPIETLGCITRMEYKLNQLISVRDGDPETRTMPL